jgi:hypothetical protein
VATNKKWLQKHPGVTIISRDRDNVYAEGGYSGAPAAHQVADRFHLVQSLIKAVQEELAHQRHHLLIPAQELVGNDGAERPRQAAGEIVLSQQRGQLPSPRHKEIRQQRRQQKEELFGMIKGLHAQGMRAFEIVRATGISRGRVDKWLRLSECPAQNKMAPRPGMAEYYREELRRLWDRGCQNGQELFVEIRKLGYIGTYSGLSRLLSEWREDKRVAKKAAAATAQQAMQQTRSPVTKPSAAVSSAA